MAVYRKVHEDFEKAIRMGHPTGLRATATVEAPKEISEQVVDVENVQSKRRKLD